MACSYFIVDVIMYNAGYAINQDLGGSYMGPDISPILRIQISELERNDFTFINMYGREMIEEVC